MYPNVIPLLVSQVKIRPISILFSEVALVVMLVVVVTYWYIMMTTMRILSLTFQPSLELLQRAALLPKRYSAQRARDIATHRRFFDFRNPMVKFLLLRTKDTRMTSFSFP